MRPEDGWPGTNPGSYRATNVMVWVYESLAARMLGLKTAWGHDAFFDLTDRCRQENWGGDEYKGVWAKDAFVTKMWDTYRAMYP